MKERFDRTLIDRLESPERKRELPADELLKKLGVHGDVDVLDIGAGTGYFSIPASGMTAGTVFAVDTEPVMLQLMRDRAAAQGTKNMEVREGIIEQLPLADASVDRVIASLILHITERLEDSVKELARVLRPGGRCLCLEWQEDPNEQRDPKPSRVKPEHMQAVLEQAGFQVNGIEFVSDRHYLIIAIK
ncbi:class I SAM-dependent methyltransferase [Paenibacillus sp. JCM 10914]|uniref:class I SAM-dependent methyltransferase n=1 Tax=Paenibacillus sp. JCM 10914 TaxID=1236974 RepID=UPI0003CC9E9E|nr:class I SAM-dependent methyltransferase [Paenibacillus sp. JCM 10914]GAE09050.1 methyltransferase type 11 [Paenibacillus sp. JCM 10914]